jgi:hypothetical protein
MTPVLVLDSISQHLIHLGMPIPPFLDLFLFFSLVGSWPDEAKGSACRRGLFVCRAWIHRLERIESFKDGLAHLETGAVKEQRSEEPAHGAKSLVELVRIQARFNAGKVPPGVAAFHRD